MVKNFCDTYHAQWQSQPKFIITYTNSIYCFSKITNNVCIIGITHRLTEERYHSLWKLRWWGWNTYMLPTRYSWNLDWHCWASIVGRSRAMAVHLYLLAAHKHKTVAPQWRSKYSNQTKKRKKLMNFENYCNHTLFKQPSSFF